MKAQSVRALTIGQLIPPSSRALYSGLSLESRRDLTFSETAKKARKLAASYGIESTLVIRKATPAELKEFWP